MKVKATKSFSGLVTMAKGSVREIPEGPILTDLLSCGYVEKISVEKEIAPVQPEVTQGKVKTPKKRSRKE